MWIRHSLYEAFFPRRQSLWEGIFLDSKLRDKEAHKIKSLRNPKTSTQSKTSK